MRNLPKVTALLALAISLSAPGWATAQEREFTDSFGRSIRAEIESVRPPNVVLRRADGKTFVFPVEKLSDDDQTYIKKWYAENPELKLDYRFEKTKKSSSGSSKDRKEEWAYKVTVSNRGLQSLDGVKIEYTIYKQIRDRYAKDKRRFSGSLKGSKILPIIDAQRDVFFETEAILAEQINKVTQKRSRNYTDYTYEKWDEDLAGIRVTVRFRDKFVGSETFGVVPPSDDPIPDVAKATHSDRVYDTPNQPQQ